MRRVGKKSPTSSKRFVQFERERERIVRERSAKAGVVYARHTRVVVYTPYASSQQKRALFTYDTHTHTHTRSRLRFCFTDDDDDQRKEEEEEEEERRYCCVVVPLRDGTMSSTVRRRRCCPPPPPPPRDMTTIRR